MFTITHLNAVHSEDIGVTELSMCLRIKGVGPVTAMARLIAMLDTKEEPVDAPATTNAADEPGGHRADDGGAEPDGGVVGGRRSRRRGSDGGEADAVDQPVDEGRAAAAPAAGEDVGSGDPTPGRRRARRGTPAYSSGDDEGDGVGAAQAGSDGAGEAGGGGSGTPRRRRGSVTADAGGAVARDTGGAGVGAVDLPDPGDGPLSNADLSKAASMAAEIITPAAVMELLEQFGAAKVNDIADKDRREFLDILKDRVSQAKKAD